MKTINGVEVMDTLAEIADPKHTALIVVDIQNDFFHPDGHYARYGKDLSALQAVVPPSVAFVNAAQDLGIRTVFIKQLTLPHSASDSPAWLRFKCRDGKSPEYALKGTWGAELADGLAPRENDLLVEKYRPDAFVATNLDQLLRANGIQTTVLIGMTTEGCLESTVRGASYHDYYIVVVPDLVASANLKLHANSLEFFQARYPTATPEELLALWHGRRQERQEIQ